MAEAAFAFNGAVFAFEIFPDEVVVLHLSEGAYFAFGGWMQDAWPALVAGIETARIVEAVAERYGVPAEPLQVELDAFIARLLDEVMLIEAEPNTGDVMLGERLAGQPFQPIQYEKHIDMADLLTLDPIHDVDPEVGWPVARSRR